MDSSQSFWQLGDELRGQLKVSEDQQWFVAASRLAEQTSSKPERRINMDLLNGLTEIRPGDDVGFRKDDKFKTFNLNMLELEAKLNENVTKSSFRNDLYNMSTMYQNLNVGSSGSMSGIKYNNSNHIKESNVCKNNIFNSKEECTNAGNLVDKRFKTLPAAETLPRNEILGGYIFVCNNDTMQEDLKRQLFGNHMIFSENLHVDFVYL